MFPATELPKTVPSANPEKKSEQDKIKEYLRKEYIKLFYKTFGEQNENSSKLYRLYLKFVSIAPLNFPPNATLEQMQNNVDARFYTGMSLNGKMDRIISKIPNLGIKKPVIFQIKSSLMTSYYDPRDPKMRDLSLYFFSIFEPTDIGRETLPLSQGKREAFICKIRINPSNLNEIIVDCDSNVFSQIGLLNKDIMLNFRSDESISVEVRRSIETLLLVLQKIYPKLKESEMLGILKEKGEGLRDGRNLTENRPGRLKFDIEDKEVLEKLIEDIITNPQKTASIGNFEFNLIPEQKYSEISTLPKS